MLSGMTMNVPLRNAYLLYARYGGQSLGDESDNDLAVAPHCTAILWLCTASPAIM